MKILLAAIPAVITVATISAVTVHRHQQRLLAMIPLK